MTAVGAVLTTVHRVRPGRGVPPLPSVRRTATEVSSPRPPLPSSARSSVAPVSPESPSRSSTTRSGTPRGVAIGVGVAARRRGHDRVGRRRRRGDRHRGQRRRGVAHRQRAGAGRRGSRCRPWRRPRPRSGHPRLPFPEPDRSSVAPGRTRKVDTILRPLVVVHRRVIVRVRVTARRRREQRVHPRRRRRDRHRGQRRGRVPHGHRGRGHRGRGKAARGGLGGDHAHAKDVAAVTVAGAAEVERRRRPPGRSVPLLHW